MSSALVQKLDARWYPGFEDNWDDSLFRELILQRLSPKTVCLDYGCGRGNVSQMNFRGLVSRVCGVDVEESARSNPYLDDAGVIDPVNGRIPCRDEEFDVVFSDNVIEHLDDPITTFREIRRVLKPGGVFLAKTPNKWHYMPLIARSTPVSVHRFYNRLRGRSATDTFPTRYRCNSVRDVGRIAAESGLEVRSTRLVEGRPEYLRISPATYGLGFAYERFVNSHEVCANLRCVLMFELRKPA